jgi:hypothetical protein
LPDLHFTVREGNGKNKIYYAYVNNDYNALASQPRLLVEAPNQAYNILFYICYAETKP